MHRHIDSMRCVLLFVLMVFCVDAAASGRADVTGAVKVIDGDTFDVGGVRVRLFGIDAPEVSQTCETQRGKNWPCGAWVVDQVRLQYEGHHARCTVIDMDKYGRSVARCTIGGRDVGAELVLDGLAFAYRRYAMDYDLDEKSAAVRGAGLHASKVQSPAQFRRTQAKGRTPVDQSCVIKGNISSKGTRIYHVPGQRDYERTGIRLDKGERWFCSADEARAAGWRPARR